jgi:hypothetical protein
MLEQKIDELRIAVETMTVTMENLRMLFMAADERISAKKTTETPTGETPPPAAPAPEPTIEEQPDTAEAVTHQELHQLALTIVREKGASDKSAARQAKKDIKGVVQSFGAELIQDIPAEKLGEAQKLFEALR